MATRFFLLVILICGVFPDSAHATNWYVDNAASGVNNGTRWTDAWQSFAAINWNNIQPGDTVYISGGATSNIYNERLYLKKSFEYTCPDGTAANPITIQVGQEAGHNGIVEIAGDSDIAVRFSNMAYYTLSGQVGSGSERHIKITNCNTHGIYQDNSHCINYKYLEISESGHNVTSGFINGIDITFNSSADVSGEIAYCDIHDVRNDCISMGNATYQKALGYGMMKIHHNLLRNVHEDPIASTSGGIDIYNNEIGPRIIPHRGHPDTKLMNSYYRVYNNYFHDWYIDGAGNDNGYLAFLYWEPDGDGWPDSIKVNEGHPSNFMVYNNIFKDSGTVPDTVDYNTWGIMLGMGDLAFNNVSDVYVFNNYFDGNMDVLTVSFGNSLLNKENVYNFKVLNNVFWNVGRNKGGCNTSFTLTTPGTKGGTPVTYGGYNSGASIEIDYNIYAGSGSSNVGGENSSGNSWGSYASFKSQTGAQAHDFGSPAIADIKFEDGPSYKPLEGSPVIDAGVDLSSYFTTDKAGISRPQGAGWDLGAYEYVSSASIRHNQIPSHFVLGQNYPNPFNPSTAIEYQIPLRQEVKHGGQASPFSEKGERGGFVSLKVYDMLGREVATLVNEEKPAGGYQIQWNAASMASGVYFYRLQAGVFTETKKLILLR